MSKPIPPEAVTAEVRGERFAATPSGSAARTFFGEAGDAYAAGLADGAAAERDRIRQLAEQHRAVTRRQHRCGDPECPALENDLPFADLLRAEP